MRTLLRVYLVFALILVSGLVSGVQAQDPIDAPDRDGIPDNCEAGNEAQRMIFPRYTGTDNANRLVLADWTTGAEIRTLEEALPFQYTFSWSPNCRFLVGISTAYRRVSSRKLLRAAESTPLVVWNVDTGERILALTGGYANHWRQSRGRLLWSPDSSKALIVVWSTNYRDLGSEEFVRPQIWDVSANELRPLFYFDEDWQGDRLISPPATFLQTFWDTSRNWVWGSGEAGAVAFDINSGHQVADLRNPPWIIQSYLVPESRFTFSPDGTKVVVYTIAEHGSSDAAVITIWDIATMTATPVYMGDIAAAYITSGSNHPVALSQDNRYLVVGYDALRVWDLTELPAGYEERLPIYRHGGPEGIIQNVRFTDWGIIETVSADGVQRWDLHTGVYIPNG